MPPRKKIVKKAVKAVRKTPSNPTPRSPVTGSPDSNTRDVNFITTGDDGRSPALEESPAAQIPTQEHGDTEVITANDDKRGTDTPSLDSSKEALSAISDAMATEQEDLAAGDIPMAVDNGETLAPEKSTTAITQEYSSTDASSGVAVAETPAGAVTTAEVAPGVKLSDSKPGVPPRKKIVKKVVKIVRKIPVKKTPATETPDNRHFAVPDEPNAAQIPPAKDGASEAIGPNDCKPESDIPTLDSSKEALPDVIVAPAGLEAPAADLTSMVVDADETLVPVKSPAVPSQEPSCTDASSSGQAAVSTQAADHPTPLAASELKPDSKPAGKGKKIIVKKVKKVVKSGKSLAPSKSPDVLIVKAPAADETPSNNETPEPVVTGETPVTLSQDPCPMDTLSLEAVISGTSAGSPLAVSEPEPSSKPSGTGKKVVVRKVKKVVKRVVKIVKKGGEVKRVEEGIIGKGGEQKDCGSLDLTLEAERLADADGANQGNSKEENVPLGNSASSDMDATTSLRRHRRKTEVFVGGLDRDAKEDDVRKVFGKAGEIVEVRMMMDGKTGKNKGYAFVRYATAKQAKCAVSELARVEVCGKACGAAALEGDDRIFLGNIDKKWKKEDITKLLKQIGVEKIDALTLLSDPNNATLNRGFAFLEFETNRDAQIAYKKLQKKNAFGNDMNVKVAWADPLNEPDEEDMQKVKSVFVEGIPSTWTEETLKQYFEKYGEIERIVLACNMPSAKRKDFAFVNYTAREAALSCIDSFVKEELIENGSKINIKVSLAKPVPKGKKMKGEAKSARQGTSKETTNVFQRKTKSKERPHTKGSQGNVPGANPSTTVELLHVLREQASWKHGQMVHAGGAASVPGYSYATAGIKRQSSAMESAPYSDPRSYSRPRLESAHPFVNASVIPSGAMGTSHPYHPRPNVAYGRGGIYGGSDAPKNVQSNYNSVPYGNHHLRY